MKNISIDLSNFLELTNDVFHPILISNKRYNVIRGGSASGKSRFVVQMLITRLLTRRNYKVLALRKFASTLRTSNFDEFTKVISDWGLEKLFTINKSLLSIVCINGNTVLFKGLDDPEKIKSISGINDIWMEEASEFNQEDFEQLDLRLRGINIYQYQMFLTFNPVSAENWLKKYFYDTPAPQISKNLLLSFSTYLNNKFIDDEYKETLEKNKYTNPAYYDIYCLGKWGTHGKQIYTNWEVKDFSLDDKFFNQIYFGVDFGYNDPTALLKIGYKDQEIYIMGEIYRKGLITSDLITLAKNTFPSISNYFLYADSAEPDRINEIKKALPKVQAAHKSPNYKKAAIDFIKSKKIYVHPTCTEFIKEIRNYCYQKIKGTETYTDNPQEFGDHLCVTGDTLIDTINGQLPIKDLVGTTGILYCYDETNKIQTTSNYYNVIKTAENADVYEVELEDGRIIKATEDHPFLTQRGWIQLKNLTDEDSIISI